MSDASLLDSFLAPDRLEAVLGGRELPDRARGTALFADISGFTPLTEALASQWGPRRGAEMLGSRLDEVFTALVGQVERRRGSVIGFAGDAVLCWFGDEDLAASAGRAACCAFAVQRAMEAFRASSLGIKIALASGPVRRLVAGDPARKVHDVIAGQTLVRLAAGEHLAQRGEVVVDEETRALLPLIPVLWTRADLETKRPFYVLEPPTAGEIEDKAEVEAWSGQGNRTSLELEQMRPWIEPVVYHNVLGGRQSFLSEFRPCVALFVHFSGIAFDDDGAGEQLDQFTRKVQSIAAAGGGDLFQIILGDKGSYALVAFGAVQAHEDDARRAVTAALELRELPSQLTFLQALRVGISQGTVFVGTYGSPTRRTFSILGDEVNVAARLMQRAEAGEVLVTGRIRYAVERTFVYKEGAPLRVKGRSEPIQAFLIAGRRQDRALRLQEPDYPLPISGRKAELSLMGRALDDTLSGRQHCVSLVGEAGVGKSRLMAEFVRLARQRSFACFGGFCQSDGRQTAYLPWRPIWNAFFDIDPAAPLRRQLRSIESLLEDLVPGRTASLPLLAPVLGLELPDNETTQGLDPQSRKTMLHSLLADLLAASEAEEPVLIVLEDLHWADPLSLELLTDLCRPEAPGRVLFALAYRPPEATSPLARVLAGWEQLRVLKLSDLGRDEMADAARAQWFHLFPEIRKALPSPVLETLLDLAQGNPFYMEELLHYLRDRGIDPTNEEALEGIDLPESLQSLILARIDQLTEGEKLTLKVASVVGRLFAANWLPGFYPELGDLEAVTRNLAVMAGLDLTPLDTPEPELRYLFKHILTHEVAYENLPFDLRDRLHGRLAAWLEAAHDESTLVDALAWHWGKTSDRDKQREYFRKAAEAARSKWANVAALGYYNQLLPLVETPAQRVELLLIKGQILNTIGRIDEAEPAFKAALELADQAGLAEGGARARGELGSFRGMRGDTEAAHVLLAQALQGFEALRDKSSMAWVLNEDALFLARTGNFGDAETKFLAAMNLAHEVGDRSHSSTALNYLGSIAHAQGDYARAMELYQQSLEIKKELGDRGRVSMTLNNMGVVATDMGDFERATAFLSESLDLRRSMGNKSGVAACLANSALIEERQAHWKEALAMHLEAAKMLRELQELSSLAIVLSNVSRAANRLADWATAQAASAEGLGLQLALKDGIGTVWGLLAEAVTQVGLKNFPRAAALLGAGDALRVRVGLDLGDIVGQEVREGEAACRQALEPSEYARARDEGAGLDLEKAIALALA